MEEECTANTAAGFGGLEFVRAIAKAPVHVTLIDQRNHHLFQPLLYKVATAGLSAPDIAAPLRHILRRQRNVEVRLAEVAGVDASSRQLQLGDASVLDYDYLLLATGATHAYFGHDEWAGHAPGLKTLDDALRLRRHLLVAFERAEAESDPARRAAWLSFAIVGGGPAGLATAIRLKQLAQEKGADVNVCVLEKGSEPGAHILSGAIMDPRALNELIPNWKELGAPLNQPVTEDKFLFLNETGSKGTPPALLPECFHNEGNYIVSLSNFVRWLGQQAEALGVEIFPGFAAVEVLYDENGAVRGVATGDMGVARDGSHTDHYQPGMELHARYTVFAEGARGQLGRQLIERYKLDDGRDPQAYGIGIKEMWEVDPAQSKPGLVIHTAGWPLDADTYGGSFLYHLDNNLVAVGMIVGLDYANPWLSPFDEFQRYKTHPAIRGTFEGGKRIAYGARAITAGGLLSLPKLTFPGGVLVGCGRPAS